MLHDDTFALDVIRARYFRPGTENMGSSPECTELQELYKDRIYDANIASAAKTTARQRFGGALRRNDRDRDGGGSNICASPTSRTRVPDERRWRREPPSQRRATLPLAWNASTLGGWLKGAVCRVNRVPPPEGFVWASHSALRKGAASGAKFGVPLDKIRHWGG
eukprot:jgi/Tetstr1/448022/TSEL_035323.t1